MIMRFKQRVFSWFDSYDIYNFHGDILYTVKGQLSWGHCFKIFDSNNIEVGMVKQKLFTFLPRFEIYTPEGYMGSISKEFSFLTPRYNIDFNGWHIEGNFFEWDYQIYSSGALIATVSKELFNWSDTYTIDVDNPINALPALMLVLAIDAEKCSRN